MYGDELCDYQIQIYWFVIIDMLGGATGIGPLTRQGHPMGKKKVNGFYPLPT
jgi:hypothetical protein